MIVLIPYIQFIKPFLDNEIFIFEEYGAFNGHLRYACLPSKNHYVT